MILMQAEIRLFNVVLHRCQPRNLQVVLGNLEQIGFGWHRSSRNLGGGGDLLHWENRRGNFGTMPTTIGLSGGCGQRVGERHITIQMHLGGHIGGYFVNE